MRALQIAATGMAAQQTRVEVISQNLANMSTTGYNARRAEFADLAYQQVTRPGTIAAADGSQPRELTFVPERFIRRFPDQDRFLSMIREAGFGNASYRNLSLGVAAIHSAWKI